MREPVMEPGRGNLRGNIFPFVFKVHGNEIIHFRGNLLGRAILMKTVFPVHWVIGELFICPFANRSFYNASLRILGKNLILICQKLLMQFANIICGKLPLACDE